MDTPATEPASPWIGTTQSSRWLSAYCQWRDVSSNWSAAPGPHLSAAPAGEDRILLAALGWCPRANAATLARRGGRTRTTFGALILASGSACTARPPEMTVAQIDRHGLGRVVERCDFWRRSPSTAGGPTVTGMGLLLCARR